LEDEVNLVGDVLDQPVIDRNGHPMGRVDGIVLELRDGLPPHVVSLAIGPRVLGERLHPAIGRWVAAIEDALGLSHGRPVDISASAMRIANSEVRVDVAIGDTSAGIVEQRLRRWILRLPRA
jgi:hypothetical protein